MALVDRALAIYDEASHGCCLRYALDEGNLGDEAIALCLAGVRPGHAECQAVCEALGRMIYAERLAFRTVLQAMLG